LCVFGGKSVENKAKERKDNKKGIKDEAAMG
jgi:hypothetical protein